MIIIKNAPVKTEKSAKLFMYNLANILVLVETGWVEEE